MDNFLSMTTRHMNSSARSRPLNTPYLSMYLPATIVITTTVVIVVVVVVVVVVVLGGMLLQNLTYIIKISL